MMNNLSVLIKNIFKDKHFLELSKGTISALILKLSGLFFGFLFTLMIAKYYGTEALGNFVLAGILISIFSIISVLGLDNTLLVFSSQLSAEENKKEMTNILINIYLIIIPFSLLLSIILFFSSEFLSKSIFNNDNLTYVLKISSLCILPFSFIKLNSQFLRGKKKVNQYVFFSLVLMYLLSTILLFLLKNIYKNSELVIYIFVLSVLITSLLSFFSILRYLSFERLKLKISFKSYFLNSHPIIYSDLLKSLKQWIGPLILGFYLIENEVGVFSITYKLASVTSIIIYSVNSLAMPKYGELYGLKDKEGLQKTLNASSKLAFWLSLPVVIIVILFSKLLLNQFGSDFSHSFIPLIILSFGQLAECFSASTNYFLQVVEEQKIYMVIVLVSTFLIIITSLILIPYLQITGVAIAYSLGTILQVILTISYIKKNMGLKAFYQPLDSLKKLWVVTKVK